MSEQLSPYKSPRGQAAVFEAYDKVLELWPVPHEALQVASARSSLPTRRPPPNVPGA